MANTYRGTQELLRQRITESYSPQAGFVREFEYRGLSYTKAAALANLNAANGVTYTLTNQQGIATLVLQDSSGATAIDTWEIGVTHVSASSFFNPLNNNHLFELIDWDHGHDKAVFLKGIQDKTKWDEVYKAMTNPNKASNQLATLRAYDRFALGGDSFWTDQYTVRHTTNVSTRYPYNIADAHKNFIYTPAQFYTEVQSALLWLYPMPNSFVNVLISNPPIVVPSLLAPYYLWGYLKGGSSRTTAANNRTQIVTEYRQYAWSVDEYSVYS